MLRQIFRLRAERSAGAGARSAGRNESSIRDLRASQESMSGQSHGRFLRPVAGADIGLFLLVAGADIGLFLLSAWRADVIVEEGRLA